MVFWGRTHTAEKTGYRLTVAPPIFGLLCGRLEEPMQCYVLVIVMLITLGAGCRQERAAAPDANGAISRGRANDERSLPSDDLTGGRSAKEIAAPEKIEGPIAFTQLDITERFDDNQRLGEDDWISTTALNATTDNPESMGLPPSNAGPEEVYRVAAKMSAIRESIQGLHDGVYCPICHIANVDARRLRKPCPRCGRPLLKFGWD